MQCVKPVTIAKHAVTVPCGRCLHCYHNRRNGWTFRLREQDKVSKCAYFITLTYDTENVPISNKGFLSLQKHDLQCFLKRLRKNHQKEYWEEFTEIHHIKNPPKFYPIKYAAVGEYGGKFKRPHYHLILFNASQKNIAKSWSKNNELLGMVHFGTVSGPSVAYTLSYIMNGRWKPAHKNDDRQPQFALWSQGLGLSYTQNEKIRRYHHQGLDQTYYCVQDGHKISMPRYYKKKIYTDEQTAFIKARVLPTIQEKELEKILSPGNYFRDQNEKWNQHQFQIKKQQKSNHT